MAQETNEQKARELAQYNGREYRDIYYGDVSSEEDCYDSAMAMAKWKDEEHNECKKDILTLVKLIPCNEGNESIINDIKNLLR